MLVELRNTLVQIGFLHWIKDDVYTEYAYRKLRDIMAIYDLYQKV